MSEPNYFLFFLLGFPIGVAGVCLFKILKARGERPYPWGFDMAYPKPIPMFCPDCGKALVSFRSMDGYNEQTGKPSYSYRRACVDLNRRGGPGTPGAWPYCGARARQQPLAEAHNHENPNETSTDCPVCVDIMLRDGVINFNNARAFLAKTDIRPEPEPNDFDTLYGLALARSGRPAPPTLTGPYGLISPPPATPPKRKTSVTSKP